MSESPVEKRRRGIAHETDDVLMTLYDKYRNPNARPKVDWVALTDEFNRTFELSLTPKQMNKRWENVWYKSKRRLSMRQEE